MRGVRRTLHSDEGYGTTPHGKSAWIVVVSAEEPRMAKRTDGKSKLTAEMRERLVKAAAEARRLVYGEAGYPGWGTSFAEIEADAKEVGHEFIRLLMEQTAGEQAAEVPESALASDSGEQAQWTGQEKDRTLITESGVVSWREPQAYLPKSRKDFFPSDEGLGAGCG